MAATEKKACEMWCPMVRKQSIDGAHNTESNNRNPAFSYCIGSRCMAWRWHGESTGYCGLAGKE